MNSTILTYIIIMAVMILFSAYFSATETAFSSLNRTRLKTIAEKGNRKAVLALRLSDDYDKLISTILIGNNIVNIATASLGTVLFVKLCGDIGATVSTVVVTIVVLVFGEVTPKSVAKDCPEQFSMFSAPIIRLLIWVMTPLNFLFTQWKKLVSRMFKLQGDTRMSREELLMLVEEVQQDGSIDENEGELLANAIQFRDREAGCILTHRVELEAVSLETSKETIAQVFSQSRYSRLLVYEGTIDNVVGVLHRKDFYTGTGITEEEIQDIITQPIFVRRTETISRLLRLLQKNKSHLAVVLDEYGGTYGIVTMEDILEELVGEIWDEHDDENESFKPLDADTWHVEGTVSMEDFCRFFQMEADTASASVGGWIMERLGKIPAVGDGFTCGELSISVSAVDFHRVTGANVHRIANAENE